MLLDSRQASTARLAQSMIRGLPNTKKAPRGKESRGLWARRRCRIEIAPVLVGQVASDLGTLS
jgi:hypothetical protein